MTCIGACAWDTMHVGCREEHGLLLCDQCERPLRCIAHEGHGAMLADGTTIDLSPSLARVPADQDDGGED